MIDTHERILQLLKQHNMTMAELCRRSDISPSTINISHYRGSMLKLDTIERICNVFDLTLAEFFTDPGVEYPPVRKAGGKA